MKQWKAVEYRQSPGIILYILNFESSRDQKDKCDAVYTCHWLSESEEFSLLMKEDFRNLEFSFYVKANEVIFLCISSQNQY